ncbi:Cysteine-rich secretory protein family protein [Streptomyces sp. YIM 130001]|uniref:CAP domain-containing protein n=1 Tax=Streptomyces sp. YIM 130001 TaxID=2259644 RepID=UPI000E65D958|nr:CAP domain-containing protein [Streptomyces sp. YIM 130001]RII12275.1 Cysteine-rich secretory protein family protein [Streptomyces sp. YIM 130001]
MGSNSELVAGGNLPLPVGEVTVHVPGPYDVSALITGDDGKVRDDADFVFFNQPTAPGARLSGERLVVDPRGLRPGAGRVTVVVSPSEPGTPLSLLPAPQLRVTDAHGRVVAAFKPARAGRETVLLLAELYRRPTGWKVRAIGQGYADGLAGVARDFGVDVADDGGTPQPPDRRPPPAPRQSGPATAPPGPPPGGDVFLTLTNAARARAGAPPVTHDARLAAAAQSHASVMAARGALDSTSPDGTSVFQRVTSGGYAFLSIGEHLVSGPRSPAEFVEYCLSQERSRRTLQDPQYTQAAVAQAGGRDGDVFWTALWARPLTPAGLSETAAEVVALTNAERAAAGLGRLAADGPLTAAAQAHSADMIARAFYAHTAPDGGEPWHRAAAAGSTHRRVGENIACGQRSPAEVVQGWMDSPGHRANILTPEFSHLGIGFAGGGSAGTYWTQLFGG